MEFEIEQAANDIYEKACEMYKSSEINSDIIEKVAKQYFNDIYTDEQIEAIYKWYQDQEIMYSADEEPYEVIVDAPKLSAEEAELEKKVGKVYEKANEMYKGSEINSDIIERVAYKYFKDIYSEEEIEAIVNYYKSIEDEYLPDDLIEESKIEEVKKTLDDLYSDSEMEALWDSKFKELVPKEGKANSDIGEIMRCFASLSHALFQNGDIMSKLYQYGQMGYYNKAESLDDTVHKLGDTKLIDLVDKMWNTRSETAYDHYMAEFYEYFVNTYLKDNKKVKEEPNTKTLLSKIFAQYPDISEEDEDYLNGLNYEELVSEIKNRGWEDLLEESKKIKTEDEESKKIKVSKAALQRFENSLRQIKPYSSSYVDAVYDLLKFNFGKDAYVYKFRKDSEMDRAIKELQKIENIPGVYYDESKGLISKSIYVSKDFGDYVINYFKNNSNKAAADKGDKEVKEESEENPQEFEYRMLARLKSDCDYYLGNGNKNAEHCLWAKNEQGQIDKMREIYNQLKEKPEWLSEEDINNYARKMGVVDLPSTTDGTAKKEIQNMLDRAEKRSKEDLEEDKEYEELFGSYYVKVFNDEGTDIDTIGFDSEQEAIEYAENEFKKNPDFEIAVYNSKNKECLYDYKLEENNKLQEEYKVWQRYFNEDGTTTTEYIQSFNTWNEAQRFVNGLSDDPNCMAWIEDENENKIEDPIKDDVINDLGIEMGSDEEEMLNNLYESDNECPYSLQSNCKEYYLDAFPEEEYFGNQINSDLTFDQLLKALDNGDNIYDVIECHDSVVREGLFQALADILNVDYDVIYKKWLYNDKEDGFDIDAAIDYYNKHYKKESVDMNYPGYDENIMKKFKKVVNALDGWGLRYVDENDTYCTYRSRKDALSIDEVVDIVLDTLPELQVYHKNDSLIYFKAKAIKKESLIEDLTFLDKIVSNIQNKYDVSVIAGKEGDTVTLEITGKVLPLINAEMYIKEELEKVGFIAKSISDEKLEDGKRKSILSINKK